MEQINFDEWEEIEQKEYKNIPDEIESMWIVFHKGSKHKGEYYFKKIDKKKKCMMWKEGKCNSDYYKNEKCDGENNKNEKCDGENTPKKCPYKKGGSFAMAVMDQKNRRGDFT